MSPGSISEAYLALLLSTLLLAPPAHAQLVRGRITDSLSGRPVVEATVQVLNPDSSLRALSTTRRNGDFSMRPLPGTFLLRVDRLGFATVWSKPLPLTGFDTLNFDIRLPRAAITLESLNVVAVPSGRLDPSGFYRRKGGGWGKFVEPEEVAKIRPIQIADLLVGSVGFTSHPAARGWLTRMENRGRYCSPTVYLDHALVAKGGSTPSPFRGSRSPGEGVRLDELVPASLIRAVELYENPGEAPAEFHAVGGGGGTDCGVIVLWTYVGFGR